MSNFVSSRWDKFVAESSMGPESFGDIIVQMQKPERQQKILDALALLEERASEEYTFVNHWLNQVTDGTKSGIEVVSRAFQIAPPSIDGHPLEWIASILYHEAIHAWQYETGEDGNYEEIDVETPANLRQIELLKKIGGAPYLINHLNQIIQQGDHSDLNGDGVYDWEDWKLRNWEQE